jgi:hypothetical protein
MGPFNNVARESFNICAANIRTETVSPPMDIGAPREECIESSVFNSSIGFGLASSALGAGLIANGITAKGLSARARTVRILVGTADIISSVAWFCMGGAFAESPCKGTADQPR